MAILDWLSRYIDNPLLINGFKFDLRIYVLVTSFDPLVIWVYEEGLCRFATEKYEWTNSLLHSLRYKSATETYNRFVHLTNYSVNKMNKSKFVPNKDETVENYGSKWYYLMLALLTHRTLAATRKYFESVGIDFDDMLAKVNDIVVKTLLSIRLSVTEATDKFIPFRWLIFLALPDFSGTTPLNYLVLIYYLMKISNLGCWK